MIVDQGQGAMPEPISEDRGSLQGFWQRTLVQYKHLKDLPDAVVGSFIL